jgi:hypothetical protein
LVRAFSGNPNAFAGRFARCLAVSLLMAVVVPCSTRTSPLALGAGAGFVCPRRTEHTPVVQEPKGSLLSGSVEVMLRAGLVMDR